MERPTKSHDWKPHTFPGDGCAHFECKDCGTVERIKEGWGFPKRSLVCLSGPPSTGGAVDWGAYLPPRVIPPTQTTQLKIGNIIAWRSEKCDEVAVDPIVFEVVSEPGGCMALARTYCAPGRIGMCGDTGAPPGVLSCAVLICRAGETPPPPEEVWARAYGTSKPLTEAPRPLAGSEPKPGQRWRRRSDGFTRTVREVVAGLSVRVVHWTDDHTTTVGDVREKYELLPDAAPEPASSPVSNPSVKQNPVCKADPGLSSSAASPQAAPAPTKVPELPLCPRCDERPGQPIVAFCEPCIEGLQAAKNAEARLARAWKLPPRMQPAGQAIYFLSGGVWGRLPTAHGPGCLCESCVEKRARRYGVADLEDVR